MMNWAPLLGEALIAPTKNLCKSIKELSKNAGVRVKACSHITGGGFYENVPRMLTEGTRAVIEKRQLSCTADFQSSCTYRRILEEQMMYNTYNMGLGMVAGCSTGRCG